MSTFIRRFLQDPGEAILLNIESVNILDLTPPSAIIGVGSGTVCLVGEFENGPFNSTTEVFTPGGFQQAFGSLGYQYGSLLAQNPCARGRKADGALVSEAWNGNGAVQVNGKTFSRLLICRVDTSVGPVSVQRLAFLTGAAKFAYQLVTGQVLQLDVGAGPTSATFTGAPPTAPAAAGGQRLPDDLRGRQHTDARLRLAAELHRYVPRGRPDERAGGGADQSVRRLHVRRPLGRAAPADGPAGRDGRATSSHLGLDGRAGAARADARHDARHRQRREHRAGDAARGAARRPGGDREHEGGGRPERRAPDLQHGGARLHPGRLRHDRDRSRVRRRHGGDRQRAAAPRVG